MKYSVFRCPSCSSAYYRYEKNGKVALKTNYTSPKDSDFKEVRLLEFVEEVDEEFEEQPKTLNTKTLKSAQQWDCPPSPALKYKYVAEPPGLGLSKYWQLPDTHELYIPSVKHDCRYSMKMCGLLGGEDFETSEHSDNLFKKDCLAVWEKFKSKPSFGTLEDLAASEWLYDECYIFYGIVSSVGKYRWPKESTDLEVIKAEMGNVIRCLDILKAAGETNVCLTMFQNVESI